MPKPEVVVVNGCDPRSWAAIRCPGCRAIGFIGKDQYEGRASILCPVSLCGYQEKHDLREEPH